jgi:hypothetical protein
LPLTEFWLERPNIDLAPGESSDAGAASDDHPEWGFTDD